MRERYCFSFETAVLDHDCDALLNLKPSAALRHMQTAATEHLVSLDLPYERLFQEGTVFMLAAVAVKFLVPVKAGDTLVVATAPVATKGAQMLRETMIFSPEGTPLIEGQTAWVMVNPHTQALVRPSHFGHTLPLLGGEYHPFVDVARLKIPLCDTFLGERLVRFSDLDRNSHMNNTIYADVVCDCFGDALLQGKRVDSLFVKYKQQARCGEILSLFASQAENQGLVTAKIGESTCFEAALHFGA